MENTYPSFPENKKNIFVLDEHLQLCLDMEEWMVGYMNDKPLLIFI